MFFRIRPAHSVLSPPRPSRPWASRALAAALSLSAGLDAAEPAPSPPAPKPAPIDFAKEIGPAIEKYCYECHTGDEPEADFSLYFETERDFLKRASSERPFFQRMAEVLREHEMPPSKHPQPSNAERERVIEWVERRMLALAPKSASNPIPARVGRLSHSESAGAVRELLERPAKLPAAVAIASSPSALSSAHEFAPPAARNRRLFPNPPPQPRSMPGEPQSSHPPHATPKVPAGGNKPAE